MARTIPEDCLKNNCDYKLPHYHCKICGKRILMDDGDRHERYHPCCSAGHIREYNAIFFCKVCREKLFMPNTRCPHCGHDNYRKEATVKPNPKPVTDLLQYRSEHPRWIKKKFPRL